MSGVAKKRTTQIDQRKVGSIKIRRIQNEDYQIDSSNNMNSSPNWEGSLSTPNFDLFENVLQSAVEPTEKLNSGLVIQSVTSLNPRYDAEEVDEDEEEDDDAYPPEPADSPTFLESVGNMSSNDKQQADSLLLRTALLNSNKNLRMPRKPVAPTNVLLMLDTDDGGKYFPCRLCELAFIHKNLLVRHMQENHPMYIICKLCASFFESREKFNTHLSCHRSTLPPNLVTKCPLCLRVLVGKNTVGRHMEVHSVTRKYQCEVCKHRFKRPDHLKVHRQNVHRLPPLETSFS